MRAAAASFVPLQVGKSTLFNLITGHLVPTRGHVFFHDQNITGLPPHKICQLGMGRSFQRTNIFPRLSVFDNVQVAVLHQGEVLAEGKPDDVRHNPEVQRVYLGEAV